MDRIGVRTDFRWATAKAATVVLVVGLAAAVVSGQTAMSPRSAASVAGHDMRPVAALFAVVSPAVSTFTPPIRDYVGNRRSFGARIPVQAATFAGKVHVGDDCGWDRAGEPVCAIANGVVWFSDCLPSKRGQPSWGNLIVVEHRLANGERLCSLYGHLGDDRRVRAGDVVRVGQVIGSIGPANSRANGNYPAHLHFALHMGGYVPRMVPGERAFLGNATCEHDGVVRAGLPVKVLTVVGLTATLDLGGRVITTDREAFQARTWQPAPGGPYAAWITGYQSPAVGTLGWVDPPRFLAERCRSDR